MKKGIWINKDEFLPLSEKPRGTRSLSEEFATRKRSIDFEGAFSMYLPDPDPVLRKTGRDMRVYRELLSDAHLGATVESRKSGTKSLEWRITHPNPKSPEALLVQEALGSLDMEHAVGEILNAPLFGFQPIEVIWERRGRYLVPKDLVGKPPEWFTFSSDGKLLFRTRENPTGETVPPKKFLLPRNNPSYANPYGERVLSRCFWPVTFKRGGMKFWVVFTEKYGMPFLLGRHPRGTREEEVEALLTSLEAMVQDAVAVIPEDSTVEIKDVASRGASADIYERLLNFMNAEISKAILGQTLTTELGKTGSYAAAQTHMEVRGDIIEADKRLVASTMNTLVKWICELNFPHPNPPRFTIPSRDDAGMRLAERDRILSACGVKFTKSYFMKTYGLSEEDIDD
jgi:phage gp29-like protein